MSADYYYLNVAHNVVGDNISNSIIVSVGRTTLKFNLTSDANNPDIDGEFYLIWTPSNFSNNYTIYYYDNYISEINGSVLVHKNVTPLKDWTEETSYQYFFYNWNNEINYFMIIAFNDFGNYSSNCIRVVVLIPDSETEVPNNNSSGYPNFEFPIYFIIFPILLVLLIVVKERKR